jgi:hypothetical protein
MKLFNTLMFILVFVAVPGAALAQQSSPNGLFTLNRQASDDVNRVIETTVARMNFVLKPTTRGNLRRTNPVYERVSISNSKSEVSIAFDNLRPMVSPVNGQPIKWTREDGKKFDLSTEWQNGSHRQTLRGKDGTTTRTFFLSPDGRTLTIQVLVSDPKLPVPLQYRLVFNRAS